MLHPGHGRRRAPPRARVSPRAQRVHPLGDARGQLVCAGRCTRRSGPADAALVLGRAAARVTVGARESLPGRVARIKTVADSEAQGALAEIYARSKERSVAKVVPEILRTMSLRPDFLAAVDAASRLHFTDGALTPPQHEMVASYVSALNKCRY